MATVLCYWCEEFDMVGYCAECKRPICGDCTGMRDGQGNRVCKERCWEEPTCGDSRCEPCEPDCLPGEACRHHKVEHEPRRVYRVGEVPDG